MDLEAGFLMWIVECFINGISTVEAEVKQAAAFTFSLSGYIKVHGVSFWHNYRDNFNNRGGSRSRGWSRGL